MQAFLAIVHEMVKYVGILYLAQLLVGVFNWPARENNPMYRFLRFLTSPVTKVVRAITPAAVSDGKVPVVAFILLFWVWLALIFVRLSYRVPVAA